MQLNAFTRTWPCYVLLPSAGPVALELLTTVSLHLSANRVIYKADLTRPFKQASESHQQTDED